MTGDETTHAHLSAVFRIRVAKVKQQQKKFYCTTRKQFRVWISDSTVQPNTSTHILTSWTFSLVLMSDGCTKEPMTFTLPWTTRASSGRSLLMPTLPWWYTESGSWPRCHSTSLSLSNWPGLDACLKETQKKIHRDLDYQTIFTKSHLIKYSLE